MRLRIGRLRHRVVLQQPTETRSATGGVTVTYSTAATVWGAVEPLSGRELLAIDQTQNEVTVRVVIRYRDTLGESWRVTHAGKTYAIHSIINHDARNHLYTLMCSEGVEA